MRVWVLAACAAALALGVAPAVGADPSQNSVAGGGTNVPHGVGIDETDTFSAGAVSDADGSNPRGAVTLRIEAGDGTTSHYHGDVKDGCMLVVGNHATVVGKLPPSEQSEVPGVGRIAYLAVTVQDNGNPARGEPVDDASAILLFERTAERVCGGIASLPTFPLTRGNFTVKAA